MTRHTPEDVRNARLIAVYRPDEVRCDLETAWQVLRAERETEAKGTKQ